MQYNNGLPTKVSPCQRLIQKFHLEKNCLEDEPRSGRSVELDKLSLQTLVERNYVVTFEETAEKHWIWSLTLACHQKCQYIESICSSQTYRI